MHMFLQEIITRIKSSPLHKKLFVVYFLLIFIPIVGLSFFSVNKSTSVMVSQSIGLANQVFSKTENAAQSQLQRMGLLSQSIAQSTDLRDILEQTGHTIPFSQEFDEMENLFKNITKMQQLYNTYQIRIYISDSFRYHKSNYITYDINAIKDEPWFKEMLVGKLTQTVLSPYSFSRPLHENEQLISVATAVRNYSNLSQILGVVSVDMPLSDFQTLLTSEGFTGDNEIYIVNSQQKILFGCGKNAGTSFQGRNPVLSELCEKYAESLTDLQPSPTQNTIVDGTEIYSLSNPVFGDWQIFFVVSLNDFTQPINVLKAQLLILSLVVGILVYFLAFLYGKYNTQRIVHLAKQVKKIENGNFEANCIVDSDDEIGELQNSFNFMVRKVRNLLDERYHLGRDLKGMEMKALQAQINPHFLYNTLDLILWKAKKSDAQDIADIVIDLARYYRLSLSNGNDFIPLSDEFEHIKLFLTLQNQRFNHAIEFSCYLQKEIRDCYIMKLILQPIVENSIVHGIMNLSDRTGKIGVSAVKDGNYVLLCVRDNGIGMEKDKVAFILSHNDFRDRIQENRSGSYGLLNIIDRLNLYYNHDFLFNIQSQEGKGTCVKIRIPLRSRENAHVYLEEQ